MPADYDASSLKVDPDMLDTASKSLAKYAKDIAHEIRAIHDISTSLRLSWSGTSSQEAAHFNDRWDSVMRSLFGSPGAEDDKKFDAKDGVLNVLAGGTNAVAVGFSNVDLAVADVFVEMALALASSSHGSTPAPGDPSLKDNNDPDHTAVGETWSHA
ncbi:WXG100 family type VII secretion target [Streptacidiphilus sp. ASG 303]|uniref:WXG100 family type VII secretion target n=1 Tax=Streptacidiphilus sp. ASG 303 TaxID=2896847 RepID=UPI001E2DEA01|nr:WXG100 family type VII secretion target [Streptacidiphilus sp. ASG 303]MCD0484788.1 WXG100 family type VII secretion target [Streptacidiphilus sp. ASG 303]